MENKLWIVFAVAFALFMILAVTLYPKLSESYLAGGNGASTDTEAADTTTDVGEDTAADFGEDTAEETTDVQTEAVILARDFTVYNTDMEAVKLSDHFGKPIVINFWATWCHFCATEFPAFENLYQKYGDEVVFMMIDLTDGYRETVDKVEAFIEDNGYSFPVYYDTTYEAANTYGAYSIPETVFINADGTLETIRVGALDERTLETYIKTLLENAK